MGLLVCFAGSIGSGKSSVSESVASKLHWKRAGFGDYLRAELARSRTPISREALQNLGQARVDANPAEFCRAVLASRNFVPGDDFILDGIRHESILQAAAQVAKPSITRLIFLAAPETLRRERIATRSDTGDFARAEAHPVESELRDRLSVLASAVIDASRPLDEVTKACQSAIGEWQLMRQ
jgi:dephospho-CoA kinase